MMVKAQRQGGGGGGIFNNVWKPTLLISSLLCLCILHSFVAFHPRLNPDFVHGSSNDSLGLGLGLGLRLGLVNNVSAKVALNRGTVMYALTEDSIAGFNDSVVRNGDFLGKRKQQVQVKASRRIPSLDKPPFNVTEEERIKWFSGNLRSFKILHSDKVSARFRAKVKAFFQDCKPRFFMTWISHPKSFGARELLSVESVFKWHPSACVLIISRTMDSERGAEILEPFVSKGLRVMAAAPDLGFLMKGTPAEAWLTDVMAGKTDPGEISFAQNLSNLLRLAALYKYGGIYMDSDVIILRRFSKLRNVIGAQNMDPESGAWNRLNNAVLVFDKRHPLVWKFIQEFALTFNGNKWGHNGPYLVTRVVTRVANRSGYQFRVMPPMAFYPVDWTRIHSYFKRSTDSAGIKWRGAKLSQMEKETYAIHLWNKQSRQLQVEEGSIIHHIFHRCCIMCHNRHFLLSSK